jgi:NifU-like protein involved in Fe-S cluster formation
MDAKSQERLLDAWTRGRGQRHPTTITHSGYDRNEACGDKVDVEAQIVDGRIIEIAVYPGGCGTSEAIAVLLSEWAVGKSLAEIQALCEEDIPTTIDVEVPEDRYSCMCVGLRALKRLRVHVPLRFV